LRYNDDGGCEDVASSVAFQSSNFVRRAINSNQGIQVPLASTSSFERNSLVNHKLLPSS
jgi:hypothetical protein